MQATVALASVVIISVISIIILVIRDNVFCGFAKTDGGIVR